MSRDRTIDACTSDVWTAIGWTERAAHGAMHMATRLWSIDLWFGDVIVNMVISGKFAELRILI